MLVGGKECPPNAGNRRTRRTHSRRDARSACKSSVRTTCRSSCRTRTISPRRFSNSEPSALGEWSGRGRGSRCATAASSRWPRASRSTDPTRSRWRPQQPDSRLPEARGDDALRRLHGRVRLCVRRSRRHRARLRCARHTDRSGCRSRARAARCLRPQRAGGAGRDHGSRRLSADHELYGEAAAVVLTPLPRAVNPVGPPPAPVPRESGRHKR